MKQSEVAHEIEILIVKAIEHKLDECQITGLILKRLEELGMAPPEVSEPCETHILTNRGVMLGEPSTVFVRKWEDEA